MQIRNLTIIRGGCNKIQSTNIITVLITFNLYLGQCAVKLRPVDMSLTAETEEIKKNHVVFEDDVLELIDTAGGDISNISVSTTLSGNKRVEVDNGLIRFLNNNNKDIRSFKLEVRYNLNGVAVKPSLSYELIYVPRFSQNDVSINPMNYVYNVGDNISCEIPDFSMDLSVEIHWDIIYGHSIGLSPRIEENYIFIDNTTSEGPFTLLCEASLTIFSLHFRAWKSITFSVNKHFLYVYPDKQVYYSSEKLQCMFLHPHSTKYSIRWKYLHGPGRVNFRNNFLIIDRGNIGGQYAYRCEMFKTDENLTISYLDYEFFVHTEVQEPEIILLSNLNEKLENGVRIGYKAICIETLGYPQPAFQWKIDNNVTYENKGTSEYIFPTKLLEKEYNLSCTANNYLNSKTKTIVIKVIPKEPCEREKHIYIVINCYPWGINFIMIVILVVMHNQIRDLVLGMVDAKNA